jgi:hypothetical protein
MDRKIIVGVLGTQNTGKTTFINDVVKASKQNGVKWNIFGKDYRKLIEEQGLKINRNGTEESQQIIHNVLVQNIVDAVNSDNDSGLIMDRTPIDSYVYTSYLKYNGGVSINSETIDKMWYQCQKFCRLYDYLIYIPLSKCDNVKVVDDKFRDTNLEYRKKIDETMCSVYSYMRDTYATDKVHFIEIYGSREERVDRFFRETIAFQIGQTSTNK